jgi:DNA repair protein RecO (recombination protein O)
MHSYKIEGVILGRRNYSETDRVVTTLTKSRGKQNFLARGVRKITSQRGPRLEVFNHIKGQIYQGKTWDIIGEIETINRFEYLRKNLNRVAAAYEICELTDRLIPENDDADEILEFVLRQLKILNKKVAINLENFLFQFKVNLLIKTGFWPKNKSISSLKIDRFIEEIIHAKIKSKSITL